VISYEIGVKADLWDRRARVGFNVFRYEVSDQQLIAVGGGSNIATLLNADKTRGQGVELDLQAWLAEGLLLTWGTSYNDTRIDDPGLAVAICGGGCTITDPTTVIAGATYALIDGNPLPQAPEWIHNLTLRYGVPVGDGEFYAFTDWAYRSEVNFFLYESPEFRGRSSLEGGLRVGYGWGDGAYDLAVFGRNITDQTRIVGGIDFNNLTGFINEPRTWGVEFRYGF
jgi:Outer membrane receptor proteins, mostly Fe transport